MAYNITEEDIKSIVDWQKIIKDSDCKLKPRRGSFDKLTDHENCRDCPGNYYNGGQCNYSGYVCVLANELEQINRNFELLDSLITAHQSLRNNSAQDENEFNYLKTVLLDQIDKVNQNLTNPTDFFTFCCIGTHQNIEFTNTFINRLNEFEKALGKYQEKVFNLSSSQAAEFQTKLTEISDLRQENDQKKQEMYEASLMGAVDLNAERQENKKKIKKLFKELRKHPAWFLFNEQIDIILEEAKRDLFETKISKPFAGLEKTKSEEEVVYLNSKGERINLLRKETNKDQNNDRQTNTGWTGKEIALYSFGGIGALAIAYFLIMMFIPRK